jgi:tight adherence protein C
MEPVFNIALGCAIFTGLALLTALVVTRRTRAANARILEVTRSVAVLGDSDRKHRFEGKLLSLVRGFRARIGMSETANLRQRFVAAGIKRPQAIETYFAVQMVAPVLGILIGSFIPWNTLFCVLMLMVAGYMAPDIILDRRIKARRESIRRAIPDAIDLLVICVDAGLGLDQAMIRAAQELSVSFPAINEEFQQINLEQRAGKVRVEAWRGMAARTKLPDIEAFVNMLVQTERFGTPIARALSNFADNMRLRRRQLAEERAAKTTVKLVFPLVLFIFPCMFIVLLGPAILSIMHGMSTLLH